VDPRRSDGCTKDRRLPAQNAGRALERLGMPRHLTTDLPRWLKLSVDFPASPLSQFDLLAYRLHLLA
jgi:hypothetical protein